jgi:hypothetical protein
MLCYNPKLGYRCGLCGSYTKDGFSNYLGALLTDLRCSNKQCCLSLNYFPILLFEQLEVGMLNTQKLLDYIGNYPRTMSVLQKDKPHIIITYTEPYFLKAYGMIRENEEKQGTWTNDDEILYRHTCEMVNNHVKTQCSGIKPA